MLNSKRKNKKQTIGVMTQSRGYLPPPQRADVVKKKKIDRHEIKQNLKRGIYEN